jgi:rSAM/selenodomain-associated transferase 1
MRRLILFAKRPRSGAVKTRLEPLLGATLTLELYRAFFADQLEFLLSFHREEISIECCLDEPIPIAENPELCAIPTTRQGAGDLGQRMLRAFHRCEEEGALSTIIMGADSPTLPRSLIHTAFDLLDDRRASVIAPAPDGGYVLIGQARPRPALFKKILWGSDQVWRQTRQIADEQRIELAVAGSWYDVDDHVGLERLREELRNPLSAERAPRTAEVLRRLDSSANPVV